MKPLDQIGFDDWRAWVAARAQGRVLEIGVGTGLNFSYYDDSARVVAFDPDAEMLEEITPADLASSHFDITQASAEELPFPDQSFDAAVGTLVFCTIPDAPRALAEVRRVLKPGASLRLVEHVRAHNRIVAGLQDVFTPAWKPLAGGCHLNRDTLSAVRAAGYEIVDVQKKWRGLILGIDALK